VFQMIWKRSPNCPQRSLPVNLRQTPPISLFGHILPQGEELQSTTLTLKDEACNCARAIILMSSLHATLGETAGLHDITRVPARPADISNQDVTVGQIGPTLSAKPWLDWRSVQIVLPRLTNGASIFPHKLFPRR
jgi:hypothetical protein